MRISGARHEWTPTNMNSYLRQEDNSRPQTEPPDIPGERVHADNDTDGSKRNSFSIFFALPRDEFLDRLRIEKRRAERAKSPLSIIWLSFGGGGSGQNSNRLEVLKVLRRCLRETDIIGLAERNSIGILLPDTDQEGAHCIARKMRIDTPHTEWLIDYGTYPDQIFEKLEDGGENPNIIPFILEDPSDRPVLKLLVKRLIDILGSSAGIILLMPFLMITAAAIKLTSSGPVIFKQIRIGRKGVPFVFYKFRSMYIDTNEGIHRDYVTKLITGKHEDVNHGDVDRPVYKMVNDPRITHVGRFIRKTSIDELPQLFNVLKGEMSLVGPRPPLPYEAENYASWHLRRILDMPPGLTGLWQVEGRSKTNFDDAVRLDVRYINTWSLWLDISLILRTIKVVIRGDGAV